MARRLLLVRHGDDPGDDRIHDFCRKTGLVADLRRPFRGDALPETADGIAGCVLYGGGFNVFEEERHPFLNAEARWIDLCLSRELPLLGICQGAQQIARRLGAWVGSLPDGRHEFGYYQVSPTAAAHDVLPRPLHVVQAHHHMFDIPRGAVRLAGSALFPNQAFRLGARVYGLQFHPEVTPGMFHRWQDRPWAPYGRPGAQDRATQDLLMARHDAAQHAWFMGFLGRLFGAATPPGRD